MKNKKYGVRIHIHTHTHRSHLLQLNSISKHIIFIRELSIKKLSQTFFVKKKIFYKILLNIQTLND